LNRKSSVKREFHALFCENAGVKLPCVTRLCATKLKPSIMKRIHDIIFILHKCDLNIRLVWEAIETHKQTGPLFSRFHFTQNLTHYIILESLSFFEEYNRHFIAKEVEDEYKERVVTVRNICKPIVKQISKWTGLQNFQDNFIAHPWRNKGKLVIPLDSSYDIPRTWIEFQFLKDLIHYIHEIIKSEFSEEMNAAIRLGNSLNENVKPKYSMNDINIKVRSILNQVDKITNDRQRDYDVKFFKSFISFCSSRHFAIKH